MEKIYEILQEIHPEVNFREVDDFLDKGVLDSFDIMTLVELLEDKFAITVGGKDIIPENFKNTDAIKALIEKCGGVL